MQSGGIWLADKTKLHPHKSFHKNQNPDSEAEAGQKEFYTFPAAQENLHNWIKQTVIISD